MQQKIWLNKEDRDWLYNTLRKKERFIERENKLNDKICDFLIYIIKKYLISEKELDEYKKSSRILINADYIGISLEDIGFIGKRYPNDYIPKIGYNPNKNRSIYMNYQFNINNNIILPNNYCHSYMISKKDFLKIPEIEIDTLKNLLIDLYDVNYDNLNFLIDYVDENGFLCNIKTMDNLKALNKDWYDLIYSNICCSQVKEIDPNELFPENDIATSLKNIKEIIENKKIIINKKSFKQISYYN